MEKERYELLKAYLVDLASDEQKAIKAIKAWKDGEFKKMLEEADLSDVTVDDIKKIIDSGDVKLDILERTNCPPQPTSMGNCVA